MRPRPQSTLHGDTVYCSIGLLYALTILRVSLDIFGKIAVLGKDKECDLNLRFSNTSSHITRRLNSLSLCLSVFLSPAHERKIINERSVLFTAAM